MAAIQVDRNDFANLIISFILDNMLHKSDMIIENERWFELVKKMEGAGLKGKMLEAYLNMPTEQRGNYRRIMTSFYSDTGNIINIKSKSDIKEDASYKYKMKDMIKEVTKIVKKEEIKTGFGVNSAKMDRIIEHVINKQLKFEGEE